MARLYRRLQQLLRDAGCELVRQGKDSHEIWFSPVTGRTSTVPVTIHSKPLANAVLKQAACRKRFIRPGSVVQDEDAAGDQREGDHLLGAERLAPEIVGEQRDD